MSDVYICDTNEDWLNTINKLIKNTDQLIACGNNAFNFAQANYTNQNIVNNLYNFYQQQQS